MTSLDIDIGIVTVRDVHAFRTFARASLEEKEREERDND
jgi:hypothetical protein